MVTRRCLETTVLCCLSSPTEAHLWCRGGLPWLPRRVKFTPWWRTALWAVRGDCRRREKADATREGGCAKLTAKKLASSFHSSLVPWPFLSGHGGQRWWQQSPGFCDGFWNLCTGLLGPSGFSLLEFNFSVVDIYDILIYLCIMKWLSQCTNSRYSAPSSLPLVRCTGDTLRSALGEPFQEATFL